MILRLFLKKSERIGCLYFRKIIEVFRKLHGWISGKISRLAPKEMPRRISEKSLKIPSTS